MNVDKLLAFTGLDSWFEVYKLLVKSGINKETIVLYYSLSRLAGR